MEVHAAPAVGKRLWSYVRAAFFMARNGKRKLLLSMHLLANKRRTKAVTRAVANLLTHHSHAHHGTDYALRRRDYEFSCSNSPTDPSAASSSSSRRRLAYFPCLGAVAEEESYEYGYQYDGYGSLSLHDAEPAPPLARIDYYAAAASSPAPPSSPGDLDLAPGDEEEYACALSSSASPALLLPGASGEFSVRVSNYSSEDEAGVGNQAVDADAEEFIRRFYDQLRRQNTVALLPYYMQQESIAPA